MTRTSFMPTLLCSFARRSDESRTWTAATRAGRSRSRLRRWRERAVHGAGHAVLVWTADDGRQLVEVEDRRRRGDLPLDRHAAPRVLHRARTATPARDHVVEE